MVDTLQSMASEISRNYGNYRMWDEGQMIFILSRTKIEKKSLLLVM